MAGYNRGMEVSKSLCPRRGFCYGREDITMGLTKHGAASAKAKKCALYASQGRRSKNKARKAKTYENKCLRRFKKYRED